MVVLLFSVAMFATAASAGDTAVQRTFGGSSFSASPARPVKQFPTFESVTPVPRILDLDDPDPIFCPVQVTRDGDPVKGARGRFISELIVIDSATGLGETFPVASGRFRTDSEGRDSFDFELPAELFADSFESGHVSAWSYTRTSFTNRKRANGVVVSCGTATTRSN